MIRWRTFRSLLIVTAAALSAAACDDDVSQEEVAATGQTLCVSDFEACVNPVFDAVITGRTGQTTCSSSGCHDVNAGSGGAFKIFPSAAPGSPEIMANFFAAKAFANLDNPPLSKVLLEPMQGVSSITGTHTGGDIFPDNADACASALLDWISLRVDDSAAATCGTCVPPELASCGY